MKNRLGNLVLLLAFLCVAPVLAEPSSKSGTIAVGTEWETEYHVVDSGTEGPTVLILGGIHGNEPAGWRAAEQIRHWPIVAGKLVVVPRANVQGLAANVREVPEQPEGEKDLNRNFPRENGEIESDQRVTPRGQLAMALWKLAAKVKPNWVIDLHEGYEFNRTHIPPEGKKKSVGSSVIYRGGDKMDPLAGRIVDAANATVTDKSKRFTLLRQGPVSTGLARACIEVMGAEGVIFETTFKDQPLSLRTRQQRAMVNVLLNHIGLIDRDCRDVLAAPKREGHLLVAAFDGPGTGASKSKLFPIVDHAQDMTLHFLGGSEMRPEVLEQFDVVVFPGGSGSKQAAAIGENGRDAVRGFIGDGGGYVGVCAGAYLCSAHYSWSLDLIDSTVFTGSREIPGKGKKQMWYRGGSSDIDIELTDQGKELFVGVDSEFVVRYANGPIISPKGLELLDDYRVLAWYRSENGLWKPQKGTMVNTPAIVSGAYGKGRVMSVSPHPESTPSLHSIIENSLRWVAGLKQGRSAAKEPSKAKSEKPAKAGV